MTSYLAEHSVRPDLVRRHQAEGPAHELDDRPQAHHRRSDAEAGENEVRVTIDRDRAAIVGLTASDIAQNIAIAMRGESLREFRGETGEIEVRLAFRDEIGRAHV